MLFIFLLNYQNYTRVFYMIESFITFANIWRLIICLLDVFDFFPHGLFIAKLHVYNVLTHWGRVTHICDGNPTIIGPDNGLSPGRRQAIIWTNAGILLIEPCGTNFSEILIGIHTFSFKKIHLKMSSAKFGPFCVGLNVLISASEPITFRWTYTCVLKDNNNAGERFPWNIQSLGHPIIIILRAIF